MYSLSFSTAQKIKADHEKLIGTKALGDLVYEYIFSVPANSATIEYIGNILYDGDEETCQTVINNISPNEGGYYVYAFARGDGRFSYFNLVDIFIKLGKIDASSYDL